MFSRKIECNRSGNIENVVWVGKRIHHHHVAQSARISLTFSRHLSLSSIASGRSSGIHPVLVQSFSM